MKNLTDFRKTVETDVDPRLLYKMYEGTTASILGMKERFQVLVGCRQGGQETPCIFNYERRLAKLV